MKTNRWILDAVLGAAVLVLAVLAWSQHAEISRLDEALARVEARLDASPPRPTASSAEPSPTISAAPHAPAAGAAAQTAPRPIQTASAVPQPAASAQVFDPADPAVRTKLREVLAEEEELRQDERWQRREQRREERVRQQVAELARKTELDAVLTEQLTDMLVVEQAEVSQIFREAREDFAWDEARDKAQAVRAETDARAKELLDEEALVEYERMRAEEAERWRGPGAGAPRDGGPTSGPREPR